MFFKKKKQELQVQRALELSFRNVRQDMFNIFSWLNYLNERVISMKQEIEYMPKSKEELKSMIDSYYSFDPILSKISALNEKLDTLVSKQKSLETETEDIRTRTKNMATLDDIHSLKLETGTKPETKIETNGLREINERLKNIEAQRQRTIREKVIQKITRNSKEYVKNIIISLIRKYQKIPALKLKEMVVDEQGLCSKSSFYRLLAEIEALNDISMMQQGKEKILIVKTKKASNFS